MSTQGLTQESLAAGPVPGLVTVPLGSGGFSHINSCPCVWEMEKMLRAVSPARAMEHSVQVFGSSVEKSG